MRPPTPTSDVLLLDAAPGMTLRAGPATAAGQATVTGMIVPFGQPVERFGVQFTFQPGSLRLRDGDVSDVKLLVEHDPDRPVGYATDLTETDTGWSGTFVLPDLPQSQAAADEVTNLLRDGFSVGVSMDPDFLDAFYQRMWSSRPHDDSPLTFSGELLETSLVSIPQFSTARAAHTAAPVLHLSRKGSTMPDTTTATQDTVPAAVADRLDQITARLDQTEARMLDQVTDRPPAPLDVRAAFADLVVRFGQDAGDRRLTFADMVSADNTGLTATARTSQQIIDYLDAERYFVNHVASLPFPETGIVHTLPRKAQRSQVGQAAEKVAAPSRAVQTDTAQFTGQWYKGWLDIAYELIRTSSPGAVQVAVDDMLEQAGLQSEALFVTAVEAAATGTGAAIDFTTYKSFVTSVRGGVRTIRAAAGKGAQPKFALTSDSWDELLAFVDATDRRLLSTVGPQNADGSASLVADEVTLAGIMFFESPHSTVDVGYNDNSLLRSELPPLQLAADNPQLVGRDVAVLGNIMAVTRIPAGIVKFA